MRLPILLALPGLLGSCTFLYGSVTDFRVDAYASYDGRPVYGSTLWRLRVTQPPWWPFGPGITAEGVALTIPLGGNRYVYGLLRTILADGSVVEWDGFITGLDAFAGQEESRLGERRGEQGNWGESHSRNIKRITGRNIPVCLSDGHRRAGQDRCLVFVYVGNSDDPATVRMVRPNRATQIDGKRFLLRRVTVTYQKPGQASRSTDAMLPRFVRDEQSIDFGMLPETIEAQYQRPLRRADFTSSR